MLLVGTKRDQLGSDAEQKLAAKREEVRQAVNRFRKLVSEKDPRKAIDIQPSHGQMKVLKQAPRVLCRQLTSGSQKVGQLSSNFPRRFSCSRFLCTASQ